MNSISLSFDRPLLLLLLIPSVFLILLPFLKLPKKRRHTFKRLAPLILYLTTAVLLVLISSGLKFQLSSSDQRVLILMDVSDSMSEVQTEVQSKTEALLHKLPKNTEVGVMAFSDKKVMILDPTEEERITASYSLEGSGSDIASALEAAAGYFAEDKVMRVILLSDGKATGASTESMAHYLASRGIEIDVMSFDTAVTASEIQMVALTADPECMLGDNIDLIAELYSNYEGLATLNLYDNGVLEDTRDVEVTEGTGLYTFHTTARTSGTHSYSVEIFSLYDRIEENNAAYAYVEVKGAKTVLLVAETLKATDLLAELLTSGGCEVSTITEKNLPKTAMELCAYDEIVLLNIDSEDLPSGSEELLESYVSLYGRSLLAVGGTGTFQYGNMEDTAFEEVLPVIFELKESDQGNSVALMLVLDCSMSMSNTSSNLTLAKQGAVKVVESMSDNDTVGIISFNSSAVLQADLTQTTEANKAELSRVISQLGTRQGTYYTQALQLAYEELLESNAPVRHVIFLSDGNPSDKGYSEVVSQMAEDGISVSAIGLSYTSNILESIASTGNGRYYYVQSSKDLPDIMLSETQQVVVNAVIRETTDVVFRKDSEITEGMEEADLPSLSGYFGLTAKEEATVLIATENDRPLLTTWNYGRGTATVFAADLTGEWTEQWFENAEGQLLIYNICTGFIDLTEQESSLMANIDVDGDQVKLTVRTSSGEEANRVYGTFSTGSGNLDLELTSNGHGSYTCETRIPEEGIHSLALLEQNEAEENVDYLITAFAVNYSSEYDAFRDDGETILLYLSEQTGGLFTDSVEDLCEKKETRIFVTKDPLSIFSILALIFLLASIAIRKIRFRDLLRLRR